MSQRRRMFSCPECGNSYEAYPPDDIHTRASLKDPGENAASVINSGDISRKIPIFSSTNRFSDRLDDDTLYYVNAKLFQMPLRGGR